MTLPDEPRTGPDPLALRLPGPRRRFVVDASPLRRNHDFRLLWGGRFVTGIGSMVTYVALPFQVYQLTGSSWTVGLLGLVEFVALMCTVFLGGALADAVDRRLMVRATEAGLLLVTVALLANALLPHPRVAVIFVLAGVMAALDALQRPSLDAMLPRLVPEADLVAASALTGLSGTVAQIAGPTIGGLLLASTGTAATYAVDAVTFLACLVTLQRMQAIPPPVGGERPSLRGVAEGLRYARSRPDLMGTYLVDMNMTFFGMPNALFPALAAGLGGPGVLGLLYSAPAVGGLVASAASGGAGRIHRHGLAILWSAAVYGIAMLGFGLSASLPVALAFLVLAGVADMVSGIFRMTIWNTTIPDRLRGRLAGIEMIGYSSGPTLGNLESGGVAALTGPRWSVGFGGVMCVAGTIVLAMALPAFRRYDARSVTPAGTAPNG